MHLVSMNNWNGVMIVVSSMANTSVRLFAHPDTLIAVLDAYTRVFTRISFLRHIFAVIPVVFCFVDAAMTGVATIGDLEGGGRRGCALLQGDTGAAYAQKLQATAPDDGQQQIAVHSAFGDFRARFDGH